MTAAVTAQTSFRHLVAAEVRAHLARKRMSGRQLARMLGEPPSWAARRLSGDTAMDADDLERIAEVLGMDPLALLSSVPRQKGDATHIWGYRRDSRHSPRRACVTLRSRTPQRGTPTWLTSTSVTHRRVA